MSVFISYIVWMAILINFKTCDNSPECSGIGVCPKKALYFDEQKDSLCVNNELCTSCNSCVRACPVGAIYLAKTPQEYETQQQVIDNDPRTSKELFVDRYWAVPISNKTLLESDQVEENIYHANHLVVIELLEDTSIECLIKSIPIKELLPETIGYYKFFADADFLEQYHVDTFPTLLFFDQGKIIGKIEWFYGVQQKEELINKINEIVQ